MSALAPTLQAFFTDRLIRQRQASPQHDRRLPRHPAAAAGFASDDTASRPRELEFGDLDAPLIGAFLDHLEARARQQRPHPQRAACRDPLAVPLRGASPPRTRRLDRAGARHPAEALRARPGDVPRPRTEIEALLAAPDRSTWTGRRDQACCSLAAQTGLRASELTGLECADVASRHRRARQLPRQGTKAADHAAHRGDRRRAACLARRAGRAADGAAVPDRARETAQPRRSRATARQARREPQRRLPVAGRKKVTAHVLRHTAAMRLLLAGVDTTVIALWLGHEQVETTQIYLHADLAIKEQALERTRPAHAARAATGRRTDALPSSRGSDYADHFDARTALQAGHSTKVGQAAALPKGTRSGCSGRVLKADH